MSAAVKGRLIGVGTGPGDPELMTLKAVRALAEADVVAHFSKRGANGNARTIVGEHHRPDWIELPLVYPVTTEIDKDSDDYKRRSPASTKSPLQRSPSISTRAEPSPSFRRAIRCSTAPTCTCTCALLIVIRPKSFRV